MARMLRSGVPDLDLLRTFAAVMRTGSMTAAAERTAMTQSTVSTRVRALEATFGRALFVREGRGVVPTDAARELFASLGPHLEGLETAWEGIRGRPDALIGSVALAGPAELLSEIVIPAMAPLIAAGLRPRIRFGTPDALMPELLQGRHDLVVCTTAKRYRGVRLLPWIEERFVLVGVPAFFEEQEPDAATLQTLPWVAYDETRPIIRRFFATRSESTRLRPR